MQNNKKLERGLFGDNKKFSKEVAQNRKGREKSHSAKKLERGTLLHCNGFLFHVRGFGCVQRKSAQ